MTDSDLIHVFVVFTAILILFSIGSNTLVIVSVLRFRKLRKVPNVLISNLAVSDILLAGLYIPQKLHDLFHTQNYYEGTFLCKFVNFVPVLLVTSSCYTLVCISFERCRAITTSHKPQVSMSVIRKVIVAIWILSFAIAFPTLLEYSTGTFHIDNQTYSNSTAAAESILICSNQNMPKVFIVANGSLVLVLSFLIPLILVLCNYIRLAGFIHKRGRRIFSDRHKVRHASGTVVNYKPTMPIVASISGRMENVVSIPNFLENVENNQIEPTNSNNTDTLKRGSSVQRKVEETEQRNETTAQHSPNHIQNLTTVQGTISIGSNTVITAVSSVATYQVITSTRTADNNQSVTTSGSSSESNQQTMTVVSRCSDNRNTLHNNQHAASSGCLETIDNCQQICGMPRRHDVHNVHNNENMSRTGCSERIDNQQAETPMRNGNYDSVHKNQTMATCNPSCSERKDNLQQMTEVPKTNDICQIVGTPDGTVSEGQRMTGVSRIIGSSKSSTNASGSASVGSRQQMAGVIKRTRSNHTAAVTHLGKNRMRLVKMMMIVAVVYAISWIPFFVLYMYMFSDPSGKEQDATVKMMIVAVVYAISWIPFFVLYMYMKITGKDASKDVGSVVGLLLITMATFSTAYNVIVYVIFNHNFRQAFKNILKCTWNQLPSNHLSPS